MKDDYAELVLNKVVQTFATERKSQGISHETLANRAGITRAAISHIEAGNRKPSMLMCIKISKALSLELSQILKKAER